MPPRSDVPSPSSQTRPISRQVDEVTTAPRSRVYTLAYEDIHPVIRIAHRMRGPLRILQRIIFDHELVLVVAGQARYETAERAIDLAPGDLLFITPFEPHRISGASLVEHVAVHFDLSADVPRSSDEPDRRQPYEVRLTDGLAIPRVTRWLSGSEPRQALDELLHQHALASPPSLLAERVQLLRVLTLLLARAAENPGEAELVSGELRNRQRIERTIQFIQEHLREPIDVDHLAELAGLSPSHLTRLFRQQVGRSPMDYLRRARVQEARQLLGNIDLSIKEIAARVGFDDPYHFSKVFHRIDGLPPSLYREALLAGKK